MHTHIERLFRLTSSVCDQLLVRGRGSATACWRALFFVQQGRNISVRGVGLLPVARTTAFNRRRERGPYLLTRLAVPLQEPWLLCSVDACLGLLLKVLAGHPFCDATTRDESWGALRYVRRLTWDREDPLYSFKQLWRPYVVQTGLGLY